jgi:ankyrin repeat protein
MCTAEVLQRELDGAVVRLLGAAAARFALFKGLPVQREAVCAAGGKDRRGADVSCTLPGGAFRRMQVAAQRQDSEAPAPVACTGGGGVRVSVVSEFGFEHTREYTDAAALGEAMLSELAVPPELVANARVGKDGSLYFVTRLHMERQRGLGKLLCTACGVFSASEKGLRHHQQIVHGTSYEQATGFADLAKHQQLATVGAEHPVVALALQQARQNAEAELGRARAARTALCPGLTAARDGDLAAMRALMADGWDVTTTDRYGSSALQWAAGAGHLDVVRWLVNDCGMNPSTTVQPKDGRNALHWACRNGELVVCRWLVEEGGVNPSVPVKDGTSPFHWAVWQGHVEVCKWLVEIGADWRSKNSFGCNAVQWAALAGSVPMCRYLQDIGLDLRLLNDNGHSALHKAAVKGQQSVCTWLLSTGGGGLGAAHMRADGDGNTPAEMARLEGYIELGRWLEAEALRMAKD